LSKIGPKMQKNVNGYRCRLTGTYLFYAFGTKKAYTYLI